MSVVKKIIEGTTRSIVGELEVEAPLEAVWAAIADPAELANWFPLRARVEGKVGGEIEYDWKPLFEFDWVDRITIWEPNKRLAYGPKQEDLDKGEGIPYVVDFQLEAQGGKTKVRMVHSGISTDNKWNSEYDSFYGGWTYELMSLQFYLDHHRGKQRRLAWAKAEINADSVKSALTQVTERAGLFMGKSVKDMKAGDRYRFQLAPDEFVEGKVLQAYSDRMDLFAGTAENLENGLLRIGTGKKYAFMWLALYGVPEKRVEELQSKMRTRFAELFDGAAA